MRYEELMRKAFSLARRGRFWVQPNPMVGALLVDDSGEVLEESFHSKFGGPHAERKLLERAGKRARGKTLVVNLEPCVHHGKTPPCAPLIVEYGIKRVVISNVDPNPLVSGKGVAFLRRHGVEVIVGVLEEEGRKLNRVFFKNQEEKLPWITLKVALSLDGKLADRNGDSKWISSEEAREYAQLIRAQHMGICVGAGTVVADDPRLTSRRVKKRLTKIIIDGSGTTPVEAKLFDGSPVVVLTTEEGAPVLREKGVPAIVLVLGEKEVNLKEGAKKLFDMGLASVLVEGGGVTAGSFLKGNLVDEYYFFVSPFLLGEGVEIKGFARPLGSPVKIEIEEVKRFGETVMFHGLKGRN